MARNTARGGRRRRVLNDEVLSASQIAIHTGSTDSSIEPGDTPRYGAGANIENHPQVTSFVPRRLRTFCLLALTGIAVCGIAEMTARNAESLSQIAQVITASELTEAFSNRLVAWTSSLLLLMTAGYSWLIFSLRRHRVDDFKGRYRVWRNIGLLAVGLSLNAVVGGHLLVARWLGHLVNWQLLPASAGWWLVPATLVGGWLAFRMIVEAAECRAALASYLFALVCLAVAGVHSAGWAPSFLADWPGLLSRSLPLLGFNFLLLGSMLFARHVILDVQGLIEHATPVTSGSESNHEQTLVEEEPASIPEPEVEQADTSSQWVDGSEPEQDYDEQPTRRLSKAERKRLRKQKQRGRAA